MNRKIENKRKMNRMAVIGKGLRLVLFTKYNRIVMQDRK